MQPHAALVSTPLIGSVQVRALSRNGAEMLVRAYGDPSKLVVAMEAQLELEETMEALKLARDQPESNPAEVRSLEEKLGRLRALSRSN